METGRTQIRKPLLFCAVTAVSAAAAVGACWRLAELAGVSELLLAPPTAEAETATPTSLPDP